MAVDEKANVIIDVDGKLAGDELARLGEKAKTLRKELKEMALKNDKAGWDKVRKELDLVNKDTKKIKASMYDLQKVLSNLNGSSIKDIERAQRQLRNEIKGTVAVSKEEKAELKEKAAQLEKVNQKLAYMRQEYKLGGTVKKSFFSSFAEGLNKYFLAATGAVASFAVIITAGKKAITTFAEWDDRLADVQKTTGLTRDQVVSLNNEFKNIDTRSAQLELLDLARVAGKLGLSAERDVEGFVRAADKIKVALTEDLGGNVEESVNEIGKLVDIFQIKAEFGIEEGMIKTGSAINSLGAASTANEGYIVEFTKRVAGVAPTAGISIDKVLGLAATLDMFGQQAETSSTVFSTVIPDMFRQTDKYAKVAGMSVENFSKLLNEDANEAFIRMLEGLNGNNAGMEHLVQLMDDLGIDGKRSITVLGVLANNTKVLRDQQALSNKEFEKGTSLIEEFNTKNSTMQARLEKSRKSLYNQTVELGQRLAPALNFSTSTMSNMIRMLNILIKTFADYSYIIIPIVVAIGTYTLAVKASVIMTKLFDAALKIVTTTMKIFNATTKMSMLGALAAGLTALISAFALYNRKVDDATGKLKMLNKETNTAVGESNALFEQLKKTTAGTDARREAIWRLREVHGAYIDNLNLEKASLEEIEAAQRGANDELVRKIALESQTKDLSVWLTKELEIKKRIAELGFDVAEIMNERANPKKDARGNSVFTSYGAEVDSLLNNLYVVEQEIKKVHTLYDNIMQDLGAGITITGGNSGGAGGGGGGNGNPDLEDLITNYELLTKKISEATKQLQEFATAGDIESALKVGKVIQELETAKKLVDYIVEARGDIDGAIDKARQIFIDKGFEKANADGVEPLGIDFEVDYLPTNIKPIEPTGFDAMDPDGKRDWAIEQAETASDAVFNIWRNKSDARFEYEMSLLDKQMEKELSNKNLTEEQKDKIRDKYLAKERKLKREQFRKQKGADIIQSIINTALAVVKALPNIPLSIAAGLAGTAQTAVIASQPIPQFYYGGDTGPGIGIKDDNGPIAGLVHAREYVIPEWMRKIPQVIAFERVMEGIRTTRGYFKGGRTSPDSDPPLSTESPDDNLKVSDVLIKLYNLLKAGIKAKLVYQEFKEFEAKVEKIENKAKIN